jgi:hypothetical protein
MTPAQQRRVPIAATTQQLRRTARRTSSHALLRVRNRRSRMMRMMVPFTASIAMSFHSVAAFMP